MAAGAGIGGLAGLVVYGAKVLLSKDRRWSWRDAGAHVLGGVVGGGLFPPIMAGLVALGVPAGGAYVLSGGVAWGGIWTLAQDAAGWALGRRHGLGSLRKYLIATAVGVAVSALLLPVAARSFTPAQQLKPHSGTSDAFLATPTGANVAKAEGEFLAFGALSEAGVRSAVSGVDALTTPEEPLPHAFVPSPKRADTPLPLGAEPISSFGAFAKRVHGSRVAANTEPAIVANHSTVAKPAEHSTVVPATGIARALQGSICE